jgi:hypothetical protein
MTVVLSDAAPPGWGAIARWPVEHAGFGDAMTWMGYRPLYAHDPNHAALVLVRGDIPLLGRLSARANVYTSHDEPRFLTAVLSALRTRGIPHVKVGDSMWGLRWTRLPEDWAFSGTTLVTRHTFVLDLMESEEQIANRLNATVRASMRKAHKAGVQVREIASTEELEAYCALAGETSTRVRQVAAYTDFPRGFFMELNRRLTPIGGARFYLAWVEDVPLAGAVFLCTADRMVYFSGASTRDRRWTSLQAPTAILWKAIIDAKRHGLGQFDLGGCTPTEDPADPRYGVYAFKKRWGGSLETFANLDFTLSATSVRLQERVIAPLWDRMHPLYFKLLGLGKAGP